jgi:peptidyl-prolyl cis-trans isomerase SurA
VGTDPAAERARLLDQVDRCDDFYGVYFGAPEQQIERKTDERSKLPREVVQKLDTLDAGEMAVLGNSVVMLCNRTVIPDEELTREDVQRQLFQSRLEAYGDSYLEELRAAAFIEISK